MAVEDKLENGDRVENNEAVELSMFNYFHSMAFDIFVKTIVPELKVLQQKYKHKLTEVYNSSFVFSSGVNRHVV